MAIQMSCINQFAFSCILYNFVFRARAATPLMDRGNSSPSMENC